MVRASHPIHRSAWGRAGSCHSRRFPNVFFVRAAGEVIFFMAYLTHFREAIAWHHQTTVAKNGGRISRSRRKRKKSSLRSCRRTVLPIQIQHTRIPKIPELGFSVCGQSQSHFRRVIPDFSRRIALIHLSSFVIVIGHEGFSEVKQGARY